MPTWLLLPALVLLGLCSVNALELCFNAKSCNQQHFFKQYLASQLICMIMIGLNIVNVMNTHPVCALTAVYLQNVATATSFIKLAIT